MPWLAPWPDAPDTHRMWADPGSSLERAYRAAGWTHEVPAPGSDPVLLTEGPILLTEEDHVPVEELET